MPEIGSELPAVILRTGLVYVAIIAMLRIAGKREIGQLSIFDLVVLLLIADAVQNSMVGDNTSVYGGLVAAATLVVLDRVLNLVADRSRPFNRLLEGEPRLLIREGVILRRAMHDEGISRDQLAAALRGQGIERPDDVKLAVLEVDGTISVIPRQRETQST